MGEANRRAVIEIRTREPIQRGALSTNTLNAKNGAEMLEAANGIQVKLPKQPVIVVPYSNLIYFVTE